MDVLNSGDEVAFVEGVVVVSAPTLRHANEAERCLYDADEPRVSRCLSPSALEVASHRLEIGWQVNFQWLKRGRESTVDIVESSKAVCLF